MLRKFFPRDKNYILEEAQLSLQQSLLQYLVDFVKVEYLLRHNPLGLQDEMAMKIQQHTGQNFIHLDDFYLKVTGIYRYMFYEDNQLEFIFDGREDFEKYRDEWSRQFKSWVKAFCQHQNFLRAVLDLTVFYPAGSPVLMADNRMNTFVAQFFDVKIHPQKGIIRSRVA